VAFDLVAIREGSGEPGGDLGHGHIRWRSGPLGASVALPANNDLCDVRGR
jgi:hypothetical protein